MKKIMVIFALLLSASVSHVNGYENKEAAVHQDQPMLAETSMNEKGINNSLYETSSQAAEKKPNVEDLESENEKVSEKEENDARVQPSLNQTKEKVKRETNQNEETIPPKTVQNEPKSNDNTDEQKENQNGATDFHENNTDETGNEDVEVEKEKTSNVGEKNKQSIEQKAYQLQKKLENTRTREDVIALLGPYHATGISHTGHSNINEFWEYVIGGEESYNIENLADDAVDVEALVTGKVDMFVYVFFVETEEGEVVVHLANIIIKDGDYVKEIKAIVND